MLVFHDNDNRYKVYSTRKVYLIIKLRVLNACKPFHYIHNLLYISACTISITI